MAGRLLILLLGVASLAASLFFTCQGFRYRELAEGIAWLPDRSFGQPVVIAVGTGATHENPNRLGPVTGVGLGPRIVLVDAGRGVAEALRHCSIPVAQPDTVLLTSLHPENIVGLDDLLLTGWNAPRAKPLRVLGPPGTQALAAAIEASHAATIAALAKARGVDVTGARLEAVDVGDGFREAHDGLTISAAAMGDTPIVSLAWRFDAGGRSWVVSGLNPDPEKLGTFGTGTTLLVGAGFYAQSVEMGIEAGAENAEQLRRDAALQLPLQRLAEAATRAGVGTLLVTRLQPPPLFDEQYRTAVRETFTGHAVIANDCDEVAP